MAFVKHLVYSVTIKVVHLKYPQEVLPELDPTLLKPYGINVESLLTVVKMDLFVFPCQI